MGFFSAAVCMGLSVTMLREACHTYPANKAKGLDLWDPKTLWVLPDEILREFVIWMRMCQLQLRWPNYLAKVVMALLPKPGGGD